MVDVGLAFAPIPASILYLLERRGRSKRKSSNIPLRPTERPICHQAAREPDYFGIANRADADSYFSMNRLVSATSLAIATLLVLTGCATDDDPFPVHPAATTTDSEDASRGCSKPRTGKFERGVEVVVACTRELSALITFNSNSFIGSARFWPDRVSPLPYPSLSRHLYFEPAVSPLS